MESLRENGEEENELQTSNKIIGFKSLKIAFSKCVEMGMRERESVLSNRYKLSPLHPFSLLFSFHTTLASILVRFFIPQPPFFFFFFFGT
jgi:hypothetical protein